MSGLSHPVAIIYCRVSKLRKNAEEKGYETSLDSQERACRKLAGERHLTVEKVFHEDWPGYELQRPQLAKLREEIRQHQYQTLICHATDRLSRDPIHLAILAEECERNSVELLFVTEPLDNSPEGQLLRYVKGYAAKIEREKLKERTMRGKLSRAMAGKMPGGTGSTGCLFGYRYNKQTGKREIYEPEAIIVRRMYQLYLDGTSAVGIAKLLNREGFTTPTGRPWSVNRITDLLRNPSFKGLTLYNRREFRITSGKKHRVVWRDPEQWITIEGATPAIVDEDTWSRAQALLDSPIHPKQPQKSRYLLSGFVRCGACGSAVIGVRQLKHKTGKLYIHYRCRSAHSSSGLPRKCRAPMVPAKPLEELVWNRIREVLENPQLIIAERRRQDTPSPLVSEEIRRTRQQIKRLQDEERRLVKLFSMDEVDEGVVRERARQIRGLEASLKHQLVQLEEQLAKASEFEQSIEGIEQYCERVRANLDQFGFDEKREALFALRVQVILGPDQQTRLFGILPKSPATPESGHPLQSPKCWSQMPRPEGVEFEMSLIDHLDEGSGRAAPSGSHRDEVTTRHNMSAEG